MKKLFLLNVFIYLLAFTMSIQSFSADIHTDHAEIITDEKRDITPLLCDSAEKVVITPLHQNPDQEYDLKKMIALLNHHNIFEQYRIRGGLIGRVNHGIKAKALAHDNNMISFNEVCAIIQQAQSNAKNLSSVSALPQQLTPEQIFPTEELVRTCNSQPDKASMYPLDVYTRCACYIQLTPSQKTMFQEKLSEEQETETFIQRLRQIHHNDSQQEAVIHRDTAVKIFKKIQELNTITDSATNHQSSESDQTPATNTATSIPVSPKHDSPSSHTQIDRSPRVKTNNYSPNTSPSTAPAIPKISAQQSNDTPSKVAPTLPENTSVQAPEQQLKTDKQPQTISPLALVVAGLGILSASKIIYKGVTILHKKITTCIGKNRSKPSLATQSSIPKPSEQV